MTSVKRILIVDDSTMMRAIIRGALEDVGFTQVVECANGIQALQAMTGKPFDLIITDLNMPEMNGITLVETLRAHSHFKSIPVLMVTTERDKEHVMVALQSGVNSYIVKPFAPETIRTKVQQMLGLL